MAAVLVHTEPRRAETEAASPACPVQRKLYGDVHPFLVGTLGNLGAALFDQNKLDEAETAFDEALAMTHRLAGKYHGEMSALLVNLGNIAARRQDYEIADRCYREAIEISARKAGPAAHPSRSIRTTWLSSS